MINNCGFNHKAFTNCNFLCSCGWEPSITKKENGIDVFIDKKSRKKTFFRHLKLASKISKAGKPCERFESLEVLIFFILFILFYFILIIFNFLYFFITGLISNLLF